MTRNNTHKYLRLLPILITLTYVLSFCIGPAYATDLTFSPIRDLSRSDGNEYGFYMTESGNDIYVAWASLENTIGNMTFARSTNYGANFGRQIIPYGAIASSGSNVYVMGERYFDDTTFQSILMRSTDNGTSFSDPINITNLNIHLGSLTASGSNVYAIGGRQFDDTTFQLFLVRSTDNGTSFKDPINIRTIRSSTMIDDLRITASGNNIYIAWTENNQGTIDIFFTRSSDSGASFSSPIPLTNNAEFPVSTNPQITVSDTKVYVTWQTLIKSTNVHWSNWNDIFLTASTDNGVTFSSPIDLTNKSQYQYPQRDVNPQIVASGTNVYVAWGRGTSVLFARSTDNGASFSNPLYINNPNITLYSKLNKIAVSGSDVYVLFEGRHYDIIEIEPNPNIIDPGIPMTGPDQFLAISRDNGISFGPQINLSNSGEIDENSAQIAVSESNVTVIWIDNSLGNKEIFYRTSCKGCTFPDYKMSAFPLSLIVGRLQTNSSTITVQSIKSFNDAVNITIGSSPGNVTAQLVPDQVTPPSDGSALSTLSVSASDSPLGGTFTLKMTGLSLIDGIVNHTKVQVRIPGYSISALPSSLIMGPSQTQEIQTSINPVGGFTDAVDLTTSWIGTTPSGVNVHVEPNQITPPSGDSPLSNLTVTTNASPSEGTFTLRITGISNPLGITRYVDVIIDIKSYTISASPSSISLPSSQSATSTITLQPKGNYDEYVYLTTSWIGVTPTGVNIQLMSTDLTPPTGYFPSSTLTVTTTASPSVGTFTLRIKGTDRFDISNYVDVTIKVTPSTGQPKPIVESQEPNPSSCACSLTGDFVYPAVKSIVLPDSQGFSPDKSSQVSVYSISGTSYLKLTRKDRTSTVIVPDTINPSAWGFSPNSKYFVLITKVQGLSGANFYLSLYDIINNKKVIDSIQNPGSWGFSPDSNNKYFILTTSTDILTHTDINIYDLKTEKIAVQTSAFYSQPPPWTKKAGVAGWGFSPDGNTFLLSYNTGGTVYSFNLYNLVTRKNILSQSRSDVSSNWKFSPCGDLFMFVSQAGWQPSTTDPVSFYFTSNGKTYKEVSRDPSKGDPSAKVTKVVNNYEIQLSGMSQSSIPFPRCTASVKAFSPVNIALAYQTWGETLPVKLRTGFEPATGGEVSQIPEASYTGIGTEPQIITLPLLSGSFLIEAYGLNSLISPQDYHLTVSTMDSSGEIIAEGSASDVASAGSLQEFSFGFNKEGDIISATDTTPPTTIIAFSGALGNNDWYISDVQVTLSVTDNIGGSGVAKTEYSFDDTNWNTYIAPFIINEGITTVYYNSIDEAGNVELKKNQTIKIDRTVPLITGATTTLPNTNNWYNTNVVVHFTASDEVSGIDTLTPDQTLSNEGASQSITGTATDNAGNSAEYIVSSINLDKTSPLIESILLYPANTTAGATINISVSTSDNVGVAEVTANGTPLVYSNGMWNGSITAASSVGSYTTTIKAMDGAGNTVERTKSYSVVNPVGGISVTSVPKPLVIAPGSYGVLNAKLISTANIDDTVEVTINTNGLASSYAINLGWFNRTNATVEVPAGQTVLVPFRISVPPGTLSGYKSFKNNAKSLGFSATSIDTGAVNVKI